ncbi:MAG: lipoate-protein ligase B [Maricaulis sp.]|jgi:lipoyl(octanoyl) transferase|nr:lipoate-protein ligase B [Maricaulis sp.]HAQ35268.1 lipoate-protein ligase B [Alphaproteobacteria bacterium]
MTEMTQQKTQWAVSDGLIAYPQAVTFMEDRAAAIAAGEAPELVWMLEHPPLYTGGTSADAGDLLQPDRFPVHKTGRGGEYTYHGPGQRVGYVMLNLTERGRDARKFVRGLEEWIIQTLAAFDVVGERRCERVGVWVARPDKGEGYEDKIAAIGVRLRRWVSFHGIALNVSTDLSHFSGITPCGISEQKYGVTSLADLGIDASIKDVTAVMRGAFANVFGDLDDIAAPRLLD